MEGEYAEGGYSEGEYMEGKYAEGVKMASASPRHSRTAFVYFA